MKHELLFSHKIIKDAVDSYGNLNISACARAMKVTTSRLWFYINGKRKWTVDAWLMTNAAVGNLKIRGDRIIIKAELPDEIRKKISHLANMNHRKVSPSDHRDFL